MPLRSCVFALDHLFCPKERVGWVLLELLRKKNKEGAVIIMFIVHAPGSLTTECVSSTLQGNNLFFFLAQNNVNL